ncbi:hypothetical protein R1sor_025305 [Riccia sorocarpa]|uniref:Glycolipid transfer protein domain-containing protein n=1 Tax=Riccia sorocarpa TaxID=122646 RepID=A0ABD3G9S5_9MARC
MTGLCNCGSVTSALSPTRDEEERVVAAQLDADAEADAGGGGGRGRGRGRTTHGEVAAESKSDSAGDAPVAHDPSGRPRRPLRHRLLEDIFSEDAEEEEPEPEEGALPRRQIACCMEFIASFNHSTSVGVVRGRCVMIDDDLVRTVFDVPTGTRTISTCIRSSKLHDWMPIRDEIGKRYLTRFCAIEGWDIMLQVIQMVFYASRRPRTMSGRFLRYLQGRFSGCETPWEDTRLARYNILGLIAESIRRECSFIRTHFQRTQERAPEKMRFAETFIGIPLTLIFLHLEIVTEAECVAGAVVPNGGCSLPGGDDSSSEDGDSTHRVRPRVRPSRLEHGKLTPMKDFRRFYDYRVCTRDVLLVDVEVAHNSPNHPFSAVHPWPFGLGLGTSLADHHAYVMDRLVPWLTEWSVDSSPTPDFVQSQRTRIDGADPIEGLRRFWGRQPSEADRSIIWPSVSRVEGLVLAGLWPAVFDDVILQSREDLIDGRLVCCIEPSSISFFSWIPSLFTAARRLVRVTVNPACRSTGIPSKKQRVLESFAAMAETVFTPALQAMPHVKSPAGDMLTKPFLDVCRLVLPVIDKFGTSMSLVKSDIGGNIDRLDNKYASDPTSYHLLYEVVRKEVAENTAKKSASCTNGLLWLTRAMDFLVELFRNLLANPNWTMHQACTEAYAATLKKWHGWVASAAFAVAMKLVPDRKKFFSLLGDGNLNADIESFISTFSPILQENHNFLKSVGMDDMKAS